MVLASKNTRNVSAFFYEADLKAIKEISKRTRISQAQFFREALHAIVKKYEGLLVDGCPDLGDLEAAPAHTALLAQRRDPSKTIQPHEYLVAPKEPEAQLTAFEGELATNGVGSG